MSYIHPTAIIHPSAEIGEGNYIGAYCVIEANVIIGNSNRLESFVSIGTPPEHRTHLTGSRHGVRIGNGNTIREFVTINAGVTCETKVGDGCIFLKGAHIGHDSIVEDKVTLSCGAKIGGYSYLMQGANFGLNASCHQFSLIGAYSIIGMNSCVDKKNEIIPFKKYGGVPARYLNENTIAMQRNHFTVGQRSIFFEEYYTIRGKQKY